MLKVLSETTVFYKQKKIGLTSASKECLQILTLILWDYAYMCNFTLWEWSGCHDFQMYGTKKCSQIRKLPTKKSWYSFREDSGWSQIWLL